MTARPSRSGPGSEYWFEEGCYILELLNDPADPDVSVARARVPVGGVTQWHWLEDTTERYLILSGSVKQGWVTIRLVPLARKMSC